MTTRPRSSATSFGGGGDAVDARHLHVHEHDVGAQLAGQLDGLGAVPGLADDLDVGLDRQDQPEPGADQRLVVDQEHPQRLSHGSLLSGSRTRTR